MEQRKASWHNGERSNFFSSLKTIKNNTPVVLTMIHPVNGLKCKSIEPAFLLLEDCKLNFYFNENNIDPNLFNELRQIDERFIFLKKDGIEPNPWHLILHHAGVWEAQWNV